MKKTKSTILYACISIIFKLFSFRFFFIFCHMKFNYVSRLNYYSLYVSHFPSSMIIYSVYNISWKPKIKSNKWLIGNFVIGDFTTDRCCVCADCRLEFRIILPCIINSCSWFNDKHDLTNDRIWFRFTITFRIFTGTDDEGSFRKI